MDTTEFIKTIKEMDKRTKRIEANVKKIYDRVFDKNKKKKSGNIKDAKKIAGNLMEGIDHFLGVDKK